MKAIKLLIPTLLFAVLFSSCAITDSDFNDSISLEEVVSDYDLWYVDYHKTTGTGDVPFIAKAFTLSFFNGTLYANNNITDIGKTGNGLGIRVGFYNTNNGILEIDHNLNGAFDFNVQVLSNNEIRIDDIGSNLSYYLVGYQTNTFDYDKLFYENIEFFLQEFIAWEKTNTSTTGTINPFDKETYLQFKPDGAQPIFYSSEDNFGTNIDLIQWDFTGDYEIFDISGVEDIKALTLHYDNGDTEEFDVTVKGNDDVIELYHLGSKTTYTYEGRGFIQYLKGKDVRKVDRKRTKIKRKTIHRKHLK